MVIVNAYHRGEYLGAIKTHAAHNLTPGQIATVENLICGDTCRVRILASAEYTSGFYTSTFPDHRWCVIVDVQEHWKRPEPPEHAQHCAQHCATTPRSKAPAVRLNSGSDIPSIHKKG